MSAVELRPEIRSPKLRTPEPPKFYEFTPSPDGIGLRARALWEERFQEFAEIPAEKMRCLFTGIGMGAANYDLQGGVKIYGDGSEIPKWVDLKDTFGEVPELLFLVASSSTTDRILGLTALAQKYKEQGVKGIIAVITSLAHERMDKVFYDPQGREIKEIAMLDYAIKLLSREDIIHRGNSFSYERCIDGGIVVQPHSKEMIEKALALEPSSPFLNTGFPLIPMDAFDLLVAQSGVGNFLEKINNNAIIIGPDKGRWSSGQRLAALFKLPFASASKIRARLQSGYPTVTLPDEVLKYIKEHNCTVITFDDEIREGGTIGELAKSLDGYASALQVYVVKPFFASNAEGTMTAIKHLDKPLIKNIIATDAVRPINDTKPIDHKLTILPLGSDLQALIEYLKRNLVRPNDPNWLSDSTQTNTLLRLDLQI